MRRLVQIGLLAALASLATPQPSQADEQQCRDICFWSAGHCWGSGGEWWIICAYTGQYYDEVNDICDLDAGCDYRVN